MIDEAVNEAGARRPYDIDIDILGFIDYTMYADKEKSCEFD